MTKFLRFLLILSATTGLAQGQPSSDSIAKQSYISVMSKAGTPVPRPPVANRTVPLPPGAAVGYDYYYGYGYRGGAGGSPTPSNANTSSPGTGRSLPGYDTRPGESASGRDGFHYSSRKRGR